MAESITRYDGVVKTVYDAQASKLLGQDYWRITESFRYYIGEKNSNEWVDVPAGYLTDGASVPRMFHSVIGPWGSHGPAVVVHDYLCEYLYVTRRDIVKGYEKLTPRYITRKECDQIMREAMQVLNVPKWRITTMYAAVSLFRTFARATNPSLSLRKLQLEVEWRKTFDQPEPEFIYL